MKSLCEQIDALLELDAANALVPHGIGGHARELLTQARNELQAARPSAPAPDRGVPGQDAKNAERYRKLRSIGAAPNGTLQLENGLVLVAQVLDKWVDKHGPPDPRAADARATHPATSEWRDAIEAAAKPVQDLLDAALEDFDKYQAYGGPRLSGEATCATRCKVLQEVVAAIRALPPPSPAASPWRDIASAPKDGTKFLAVSLCEKGRLYDPDEPFVCRFERDNFLRKQGTAHPAYVCYPTHWAALLVPPTPPATEGEASQ